MYKFKIGQDPEAVKIRQPLSIQSSNSAYGQSSLSLLGRDHIFSQYVDKNSNMMFIPSNIKITKTKLYSGDLRIEYNNRYQSTSDGAERETYFIVNYRGQDVEVASYQQDPTSSITGQPKTKIMITEQTLKISQYLRKLTLAQFDSFAKQAVSNSQVVQSLSAMHIPQQHLPKILDENGDIRLRCRAYSLSDIAGMSEGFSKAVNFYNSRKMDYIYVQTKLNIHPAKIEIVNNAFKSVTYRSPTIIIVEYEKDFAQKIEAQINSSTLLQAQQMAAGVQVNTGYRKKRYQRSTLPEEVVKAIKQLQTRIFMLCPKTQRLADLVNAQNGSYNDLIDYYNGISKKSIGTTWTQQAHEQYCAQLSAELQLCQMNNGGSDFTLDEYPIAKVPHFEFIEKIYVLDLFGLNNVPTGQDFTIRRKAILYKNLMTPLLDRFKVIANGKLSTVVINGVQKVATISKNFGASQVMIFNGKRRKAIQSIVGQSDMSKLVFENPMLQIPFQMMSILDIDLYAFRTCMASSISSLAEHSQNYSGPVGLQGEISIDVPYYMHQTSIFSWINTLFARRALRNTDYEGLRIRLNRLIFSNKVSGRLQAKLNSVFYNITRFKKVSEKVSQYEGSVDIEALKFAYNPGKFMNVLFLLYPAVHQLYLGDGTQQLQQAQSAIRRIVGMMATTDTTDVNVGTMNMFSSILGQELAYTAILTGSTIDALLDQLNKLLNTMQKDTIMSTLAQRITSQSNVMRSVFKTTYAGDLNKVALFRSRILQYYLQRFFAEFIEFLETLVIIIHFYAEKKFKGISDTNIHSLIVYFASLASAFLSVRIAEYDRIDNMLPMGIRSKMVEVGSTGMDIQVWLLELIKVFSSLLHYIPRPRAHKSKYTKYLIFEPKINAQASEITSYVFDAQKWTMLNTGNIIRELLKDNGRINDVKVNIWSDGQFLPQNLQFSRLLQKVVPISQASPQIQQIIQNTVRTELANQEMVAQVEQQIGSSLMDDFEDEEALIEQERLEEQALYADDTDRQIRSDLPMAEQLKEVISRQITANLKKKKRQRQAERKRQEAANQISAYQAFKDKKK